MARSNTANVANYYSEGAALTSNPISISAWFYPNNLTVTSALVSISNAGVTSYHCLLFDGANAYGLGDDKIIIDNDGIAFGVSAGAVAAANTWNHAASVNSGVASRIAYLNGVAGTPETTTRTPSSYNHTNVAAQRNTTTTLSPLDGRIAEVAIWNVALTPEEVLMLSKGVSPLLVRPNNLIRYWPLYGVTANEHSLVSPAALTVTGTMAKAEHVQVFNPSPLIIGIPTSSTSISGGFTQNEPDDTLIATGTVNIAGSYSNQELDAALIATGTLALKGVYSQQELNDILAATGTLQIKGSHSSQTFDDTLLAVGALVVKGSLSIQEFDDSLLATGFGSVAITGVLNQSEPNDSLLSSGTLKIGSIYLNQEFDDLLVTVGTLRTYGSFNQPEPTDTLLFAGKQPVGFVSAPLPRRNSIAFENRSQIIPRDPGNTISLEERSNNAHSSS